MNIIRWFWATKVYLYNSVTGEVLTSYIEGIHPFTGKYWCYVYPFTAVGHVQLHEDGTTGGPSSYITKWKYA